MKKLAKEIRLSDLKFEQNDSEDMIIEGYAIIFNSPTLIGTKERGFIESINRQALNNTSLIDIPLKYNHLDSQLILARTKNNSLQLEVDNHGLKIKATLIDTRSNQDFYKAIKSGLLDKMSFAFEVENCDWDFDSEDIPVRKINSIAKLYDVSIVDLPAYDETSVIARSLQNLDAEIEQLEKLKISRKKLVIKTIY